MHELHVCILEDLLQFRITICSVDHSFRQSRAIFPKRFDGQRLAVILLRKMTVTCKQLTRRGVYVYRTGARRHVLPMECVVGKQNQLLRAWPNELEAVPARRAASSDFAVSGEALHWSFHGGTHGFGNRGGNRNDLEFLHADLVLVSLTRPSLDESCWRNLSGMCAQIRRGS
jgi:hypothetical protein